MIKKLMQRPPEASFCTLMRWGWELSHGVRWQTLVISLLGILRVAASLWFVWISKVLIDTATNRASSDMSIWHLGMLLAGLLLVELTLSQIVNYRSAIIRQRYTNHLSKSMFATALEGKIFGSNMHSGDILNRITVDIATLVDTIINKIPQIMVLLVQLAGAFWLLWEMSSTLALCALLVTPIFMIASKMYILKMRTVNSEIRNTESQIHTHLQEGLQHRLVVQTLECEPMMIGRLESLQGNVMSRTLYRARVSAYSRTSVRLGFIAGYLIAFMWSVFSLHTGAISFGMMSAFLQLVNRIQNPISSLSNTLPGLVSTTTAIERLMEVLNDKRERRQEQPIPALSGALGVKVEHLTFGYPDGVKGKHVFTDFSYDFTPGSHTVIMGETGVGKSTLTKLILAVLQPVSGKISLYNEQWNQEVGENTRRLITYVPQGNSLLDGTIRENLLLGRHDATEEELREVLTIAVANFAYDLPQGLDTRCGELGSKLSEGQCQRIAIARALLRDCPVMILDEFNSSLDTATAQLLLQRLMHARPQATIIFISHRPEIKEFCNQLLTLG